MDVNRPFYGWANWGTWKTVEVFERNRHYNRDIVIAIDDCEEEGLPKSEAVQRVAREIGNIVRNEFFDVQQEASELVLELLFTPEDLEIDYEAIAEHFMDGYRPRQSSDNRRPKASQCKRNGTSGKKTTKPKTSGKKPAARATSRRC